jgi:hypothetical protein
MKQPWQDDPLAEPTDAPIEEKRKDCMTQPQTKPLPPEVEKRLNEALDVEEYHGTYIDGRPYVEEVFFGHENGEPSPKDVKDFLASELHTQAEAHRAELEKERERTIAEVLEKIAFDHGRDGDHPYCDKEHECETIKAIKALTPPPQEGTVQTDTRTRCKWCDRTIPPEDYKELEGMCVDCFEGPERDTL